MTKLTGPKRSSPYRWRSAVVQRIISGVAVRNSRDPNGPALVYTRAEIAAFLGGVLDGEFDDLLT